MQAFNLGYSFFRPPVLSYSGSAGLLAATSPIVVVARGSLGRVDAHGEQLLAVLGRLDSGGQA